MLLCKKREKNTKMVIRFLSIDASTGYWILTSTGRPQKAGHVNQGRPLHSTCTNNSLLLSSTVQYTASPLGTLWSITSWGLLSDKAPLGGASWQVRIISFPTCYDYDRCQLGSCASPASLWQSHPGKSSQLQLYASGFFLPLLLSPSSLWELAQRSIRFLLLYPDINIVFRHQYCIFF